MDRIRKALDLAREERERYHKPDSPGSVDSERRSDHSVPTAIVYERTRSYTPPQALLNQNRIIDSASSDPAAAAFRMLRTQVMQRMEENHWRSLAIFSPTSDDGKTTTAINLAVSLANSQRHTVLLVDFDLKRPSIAAMMGIQPAAGTNDLLQGNGRIEDCLYHPETFARLVVLPARAAMENSSEAISGPRGRELIAELRGRYSDRIVVFDLPPVLGVDDALAFAPLVECGLMVVAEGQTRRDDVVRSMELLRKTPIIGTVLNRATYAPSAYG